MDCKIITLTPNKLLLGKYFSEVKENIKSKNNNIEDLGKIIYINYSDYFMTLSDMYELDIYYFNELKDLNCNIEKVESIIKEKINNFTFDKTDLMYIN